MLGQSSEQQFLNPFEKKHARAELILKILEQLSEHRYWGRTPSKDTGWGRTPSKGSGVGLRALLRGSEQLWRQKRGTVLFLESHGSKGGGGRVAKPRDT